MKESQCADHAVIEIRVTRTANEDSPGIYTPGDRRREKKEDFPTKKPPTLPEKRKKKRSDPKDPENSPQTTVPLYSETTTVLALQNSL